MYEESLRRSGLQEALSVSLGNVVHLSRFAVNNAWKDFRVSFLFNIVMLRRSGVCF
jgi:hypothetical protein